MIRSKEELSEYLMADRQSLGIKPNIFNWLFHDIWRYQRTLRNTEYYKNTKKNIRYAICRYMLQKRGRSLGFSIAPNCFGKGLSIAHAGTIVVNSNAKVGENCRVHVCVNIGADIADGSKAPQLGDNCYIGPGAKLYGAIVIGDNVVIGANSVVNKSFSSDITIAGVPAKKIGEKGTSDVRVSSS